MLLTGSYAAKAIAADPITQLGGTVVETMMLSKKMLAQMSEMMQGFAGEGGEKPRPVDLFEPGKLKARAAEMGDGVSFLSAKRAETPEYSGYTASYAFKDINKLKLSQQKEGTSGTLAVDKTPSTPVFFHFRKGEPARLTIEIPKSGTADKASDEKKEGAPSQTTDKGTLTDEDAKKLADAFLSMKMALAVEVNGTIVETNATYRNGNRITVVNFDLSKLASPSPAQLEKLKKLNMTSLDDAKELLKAFPGMKMDMNDRLTVVFTK